MRHGQSEWNVTGRWQGDADPPLTDEGRRQARRAAPALGASGPFDAVWSSDLVRATESADLLAAGLDLAAPQRHPGLREAGLGPWQGRTMAEIEREWPGYLAAHRRPPGAEDELLVLARFTHALVDIARSVGRDQQVLVVTHAGVMRQLRRSMQRPDVRYTNLTGYWVEVERKHGELLVGASVTPIDAPLPESQ